MRELRSREEAEDAVQATFLNALRGLRAGVVPASELAWLYKIAHNVCLQRVRSRLRRGRVEVPGDLHELEQAVSPRPERRGEELMRLPDALASMPERQREAILLREWRGLSYEEIGERLGLSHSAVETLLFRARRTLARGLEKPVVVRRRRLREVFDLGWLGGALKGLVGGGAVAQSVAVVAVAVMIGGGVTGSAPARSAAVARVTAPAAPLQSADGVAIAPARLAVTPQPRAQGRAAVRRGSGRPTAVGAHTPLLADAASDPLAPTPAVAALTGAVPSAAEAVVSAVADAVSAVPGTVPAAKEKVRETVTAIVEKPTPAATPPVPAVPAAQPPVSVGPDPPTPPEAPPVAAPPVSAPSVPEIPVPIAVPAIPPPPTVTPLPIPPPVGG